MVRHPRARRTGCWRRSGDDLFGASPGLKEIVELGPGDGRKLRTLVEGTTRPMTAHLIDVVRGSPWPAQTLTLHEAANLAVITHEQSFEDGLDAVAPAPERPEADRCCSD